MTGHLRRATIPEDFGALIRAALDDDTEDPWTTLVHLIKSWEDEPIDRETLVRIIADTIPVDPDDGTTPIYWTRYDDDHGGEYFAPTWGSPRKLAGQIVSALSDASARLSAVRTATDTAPSDPDL